MSDEELDRLIRRFCGGDLAYNEDAFATIRSKLFGVPYGIFFRSLPDHLKNEAEFYAHGAMNKLWISHDTLDVENGTASLIDWLTKVASHQSTDISRKRSSSETDKDFDWWNNRRTQKNDPSAPLEASDSFQWLVKAKLSPKEKETVRHMLNKMPVEEIAGKLGLATSTVYDILKSARQKLKDGWDDAFGAG